jgi:hypothetical protein
MDFHQVTLRKLTECTSVKAVLPPDKVEINHSLDQIQASLDQIQASLDQILASLDQILASLVDLHPILDQILVFLADLVDILEDHPLHISPVELHHLTSRAALHHHRSIQVVPDLLDQALSHFIQKTKMLFDGLKNLK